MKATGVSNRESLSKGFGKKDVNKQETRQRETKEENYWGNGTKKKEQGEKRRSMLEMKKNKNNN